jgi:hypothetical protein
MFFVMGIEFSEPDYRCVLRLCRSFHMHCQRLEYSKVAWHFSAAA